MLHRIVRSLGVLAQKLATFSLQALWLLLGLWAALATYFSAPAPVWVSVLLAIGILVLFIASFRERIPFRDWLKTPWRAKSWTTAAVLVFSVVVVWYAATGTPDPNQDWAPEHARAPRVEIVGNKVHVRDVRNFTWHTRTDFKPGFYERVYDLDAIDSMYYVVAPMPIWDGIAHVFVCFGFTDGQHVAVSVEGRRVAGRPYRVIPSMFRQYQLLYVVGDERDVVGLRGAIWKSPVYFYPARTTTERRRAIFLEMMQRAHDLEERPEYYHLITNNCMNNITYHLRNVGGRSVPRDLRLLLTGFSDRVAYDYGFIDTDLPFAQTRQTFRIDDWMQTVPLDADFSLRLREMLNARVTAAREDRAEAAAE